MSSSLVVHRSGDFINLAFDPAKYNSSDGYYTYDSKLKESSASGPIAMIAIVTKKTTMIMMKTMIMTMTTISD